MPVALDQSFVALILSILLFGSSSGLMSLLFGWKAADPGSAASKMILFVSAWVQVVYNVFPLVWEYHLLRDIVLRGASFMDIARDFGGYIIFTGILAILVAARFYHERRALQSQRATIIQGLTHP